MYEVKSIIRPERVTVVVHALHDIPDVPGITVSVVRGFGRRTSIPATADIEYGETEMAKLEIVVSEALLQDVVDTIERVAATGRPGDGKVFISRVDDAIRIRSGAHGATAL
jgi:nitrogen regulatory protein P-II 1